MLYQFTFLLSLLAPVTLFRTSMCLRNHEQFSLCGWRCPPTCVNLKLLAAGNAGEPLCPSMWDCHIGCRCTAGYVRDEYSKNCILVQNCPAATAVIVASAPTLNEGEIPANSVIVDQEKQRDYYRDKRSQYQYMSPCAAAAASSAIPSIAPATYQVNLSPYPTYTAPHSYYGMPHYRSAEFEPEPEMMSYSDMMSEHMPMARYGYAVPAPSHVSSNYAAPLVPPATTSTAYGVFPNANTGGCSVPLLFSCAPSIVAGHIPQTQPHYSYGDSYRGVEGLAHHNSQEHHEEPTVHDQLNPVHDQSHAIAHQ